MQRFSYGDKDTGSQPQHQRPSIPAHKILVAAIALVVAVLLLGLSFQLNPTPTAKAATFTQVWSDEFNGAANTGVNTSTWKYDTGTGFGTGEIETMTTSTNNVKQDGQGHLVITPIRDSSGNWTSGRIETNEDDFAAPVGGELEITASLQQPNVSGSAALGYWPAFWTLGTPFRTDGGQWPKDGEVDIMEDVNGLSSVYGTLHCGVDPGGPCNETNGLGSGQRACSGCQTGFHTYTEIIDRSVSPEQIRWYLDGNNYFTVNASQMDATTWANAVDHAFFIIFDLAMGGGFPNGVSGQSTPTSATQSGVPMLVDYVRVSTAPGSAPNPTPTPGAPTATPTTGAPTATPTSSGTGFTQGVTSNSSSSATFWFQPSGWTAGYAILHYTPSGQGAQNVNMTYNSSTARWEYTVNGLSSGQTVTYSFTYQRGGLQYDTGNYSWTNNGSSPTPTPTSTPRPPTPTPTPAGCTGTFAEGVNSVSSSQAQFWFQPCGWTAGYVIVHYTVTGQTPQNVQMTYNSSTGHWEFTASISSGQTVTYSFTYQKSGLQYDTGNYTWTHP